MPWCYNNAQRDMGRIRLATVFSGVGAPEQALTLEGIDYQVVFACDNGERTLPFDYQTILDKFHESGNSDLTNYVKNLYKATKKENYVKQTYLSNYKIDENHWFDDIRFIDGYKFKNKIDLFIGGSPCQSFSNMGKRKGLEDTRGTLFYDFARLVKEMQPKVFIYENVPGMLNHDKGNTWKTIDKTFSQLGYKTFFKILNACDYGIPQNRKRIFVVGFKNHLSNFEFPKELKLTRTVFDFLDNNVPTKYYLGQKGFNFVTTHPNRAKINEPIMRTQKANQQFNWNGNFVFEKLDDKKHNSEILSRAYVGKFENQKGVIRQLTPRECFRLMGFPNSFVIPVPDVHAYRQSGNSIVVNVLRNILIQIVKSGVFNEKN